MKADDNMSSNLSKKDPLESGDQITQSQMNKHMRAVLDHLWGPTGSVVLHIILVVLLFRLVWDTAPPMPETEVQLLEMEVREIDEPDEPELDDFTDIDMPDDILPPEVALDDRPPDPAEFDRVDPDMDVTELQVMPDFQSPLVLRDLYAVRTDTGRAAMLNRHSGRWGPFTEPAVIKALEWLRRNQRADGSWASDLGARGVTAVTGLGLMAFLAHGETNTSERYGETVRKAIEFLQGAQQRQGPAGAFCNLDQQGVYAHGVATYAISEAYAMTAIPSLRDSMDAAVRHIVRGQQPGGGFDYHFNKGNRRDTSVSGWMVQAMKAALMAGSEVEGLSEAIEKAAEDLKRASRNDGQFNYDQHRPHPGTTAIGALSLQLSGHGRDKTVIAAIKYMGENAAQCSWDGTNRNQAMYIWFYQTQAKFHHGGATWTSWNNQFAPAFVNSQQEDGHWRSPGNEHERFGLAYTTALGALTLQVYYRFLPTFQLDAIPTRTTTEEPGVPEVEIPIDFI